jgi:hypothetical protein
MLRRVLIALAAVAMLLVTTLPDDAFARGGARAGGYRGGAVAVRGHGGAVAARGYRGGAVAVRGGGYRGYGYRGAYGAAAVGAAAVGAAATGAYYRSGCGYDTYGNWVCPNY